MAQHEQKRSWIEYQALGNGFYRVLGPKFTAKVHMDWFAGEWHCNVHDCNNHMVNAWDIALLCVLDMQSGVMA